LLLFLRFSDLISEHLLRCDIGILFYLLYIYFILLLLLLLLWQEEFEDTEGVIRIRISKNNQHNGQKKKVQKVWFGFMLLNATFYKIKTE
jgi:hypothetical protein